MRRRDFLAMSILAAGLPRVAWAQQTGVRRIGVLLPDPRAAIYFPVFEEALAGLGWRSGENLIIDYRWGSGDGPVSPRRAAEIVGMEPEVIVAGNAAAVSAIKTVSSAIPTVFLALVDPIGHGFVDDLEHPEGNVTGHLSYEPNRVARLMEFLTAAAPGLRRVAVVFSTDTAPFAGEMLQAARGAATLHNLEIIPVPVRVNGGAEAAINALARPETGLMVLPDGFHLQMFEDESMTFYQRDAIVMTAARHRMPAVYTLPEYAEAGGLMTYGVNPEEFYRSAAQYVDELLRGAKPGDLPVEMPGRFELVINLKTARSLGLPLTPHLLATADRIIR